MSELGFFTGRRVELIGGEVIETAAQKDTHVIGVSLAAKAVANAFGPGYWVRVQAPINLGKLEAVSKPPAEQCSWLAKAGKA